MSRSLGDLYAHEVGVSPEPILNTYMLGERDLFLVSPTVLRCNMSCCAVLRCGPSRCAAPGHTTPCSRVCLARPHPPPALQLLATDGLWDIMGNEQAADFVERCARCCCLTLVVGRGVLRLGWAVRLLGWGGSLPACLRFKVPCGLFHVPPTAPLPRPLFPSQQVQEPAGRACELRRGPHTRGPGALEGAAQRGE